MNVNRLVEILLFLLLCFTTILAGSDVPKPTQIKLRQSEITLQHSESKAPLSVSVNTSSSYVDPPSGTPRYELQNFTRFSESHLWRLNGMFYANHGPASWGSRTVPHLVTNHFKLAKSYVKLVKSYIEDYIRLQHSAINLDEPLYIVEVASGTGMLGFNVLRALDELIDERKLVQKNIVYVMTDFSEANIAAIEAHPALQRYFKDGRLDTALLDVLNLKPCSLSLRRSNVVVAPKSWIAASSCLSLKAEIRANTNPVVLIANYALDTFPVDYFVIKNSQLFEGHVSVGSTKDFRSDKDNPNILQHLYLNYSYFVTNTSYYDKYFADDDIMRAHMKQVLNWYVTHLHQSVNRLVVPITAMKLINYFIDLSENRLMLLVCDKSDKSLNQLHGDEAPHIALHGSFSVMVNTNILQTYLSVVGGFWLNSFKDPKSSLISLSVTVDAYGTFPRSSSSLGKPEDSPELNESVKGCLPIIGNDTDSSPQYDPVRGPRSLNHNLDLDYEMIKEKRLELCYPHLRREFNTFFEISPAEYYVLGNNFHLKSAKTNATAEDILIQCKLLEWDWATLYNTVEWILMKYNEYYKESPEIIIKLREGLLLDLWPRYFEMSYTLDLPIQLGLIFAKEPRDCASSLMFFNYSLKRSGGIGLLYYKGVEYEASQLMGECISSDEDESPEGASSSSLLTPSSSSSSTYSFSSSSPSISTTSSIRNDGNAIDSEIKRSIKSSKTHSIKNEGFNEVMLTCCDGYDSANARLKLMDCLVEIGQFHVESYGCNSLQTSDSGNSKLAPASSSSRIAILTYGGYEFDSFYPYSVFINSLYSNNLGHTFIYYSDHDIPESMLTDKGVDKRWFKVYFLKKFIDEPENRRRFDYVLWIDADLIFIDFNFELSHITSLYANYSVIACDDNVDDNMINTGAILMKTDSWASNFLTSWWGPNASSHAFKVEQSLYKLGDQTQLEALLRSPGAEHFLRPYIKILPPHAFNSEQPVFFNSYKSPVLHMMGDFSSLRSHVFARAYGSVCKSVKSHVVAFDKSNSISPGSTSSNIITSIKLEKYLGLDTKSILPIFEDAYREKVDEFKPMIGGRLRINMQMSSRNDIRTLQKYDLIFQKLCLIYLHTRKYRECEDLHKEYVHVLHLYLDHFDEINVEKMKKTGESSPEFHKLLEFAVNDQLRYMQHALEVNISLQIAIEILPLLDRLQGVTVKLPTAPVSHRISFGNTVHLALMSISKLFFMQIKEHNIISQDKTKAINYIFSFSNKCLEVCSELIEDISCYPQLQTMIFLSEVYTYVREKKKSIAILDDAEKFYGQCNAELESKRLYKRVLNRNWIEFMDNKESIYAAILGARRVLLDRT